MKRAFLSLSVILLLGLYASASGQNRSTRLDRIDEAIERKLAEVMPDRQRKSVPPLSLEGDATNDSISISQWVSGNNIVRIAVLHHASQDEARQSLQQFASDKKGSVTDEVLGDEAYVWGTDASIAFRKGDVSVYVSSVNTGPHEDKNLIPEQKVGLKHNKERTLTKQFAQHVAAVLTVLQKSN